MRKVTFAAIAVMTLAVLTIDTADVQGQQAGMRGRGQGQGMMAGGPDGGHMALSAGMLLRQSDALDLTESQINSLTELRDNLEAAGRELQTSQEGHAERMAELMDAETPDLNAIREEFAAGHAAMSQFRWAQLESGIQARTLLTEQQRGVVQGWGQARGQMMGARGGSRRGVQAPRMGGQQRGGMRGRQTSRGMRQQPRWR